MGSQENENRERLAGGAVVTRLRELSDDADVIDQMARLLGHEDRVRKFMRTIVTTVQNSGDLQSCSPRSIIMCAAQGAALNLEPDPVLGHFWLVPRRSKGSGVKNCTFILGYQGMIQLAMRSGAVRKVTGRVVYKADEFECEEGTGGFIRHVRNLTVEPDVERDFVCAYAVAHFVRRADQPDDFEFVVVPRWEVERAKESAYTGGDSPWKRFPDAMRAKTAMRRLFKWLQVSTEMDRAIAIDEQADADIPQSLVDFDVPEKKSASLDALADKLSIEPEAVVEEVEEASQEVEEAVVEEDRAPKAEEAPKSDAESEAHEPLASIYAGKPLGAQADYRRFWSSVRSAGKVEGASDLLAAVCKARVEEVARIVLKREGYESTKDAHKAAFNALILKCRAAVEADSVVGESGAAIVMESVVADLVASSGMEESAAIGYAQKGVAAVCGEEGILGLAVSSRAHVDETTAKILAAAEASI